MTGIYFCPKCGRSLHGSPTKRITCDQCHITGHPSGVAMVLYALVLTTLTVLCSRSGRETLAWLASFSGLAALFALVIGIMRIAKQFVLRRRDEMKRREETQPAR